MVRAEHSSPYLDANGATEYGSFVGEACPFRRWFGAAVIGDRQLIIA
jgi:hypothetical protein